MYMKKILIALAIILVLVAAGRQFYRRYQSRLSNTPEPVLPETVEKTAATTITKQEIKKENYSGSQPVISGTSPLAAAARTYVDNAISEFEMQANADVPAMREEFGPDSPPASYTIDIDAKAVDGPGTASIVLTQYVYTGGAHGSSTYKVFTASRESGALLTLRDVIRADKQTAFTEFIQKKLLAWSPDSNTSAPVVFPEDVTNLSFASFENWTLDDKNLTLYFSQYEIGPGVLGAVAFPIPLADIAAFRL